MRLTVTDVSALALGVALGGLLGNWIERIMAENRAANGNGK